MSTITPVEEDQRERMSAVGTRRRTVLPQAYLQPEVDPPEPVRFGVSRDDVLSVVGAAGSALGVGLLLTVVLGILPVISMPFVSFCWFVGGYTTLVFLSSPGQAVRDRFWTVILWSAGVVVVATLGLVIVFVFVSGSDVFAQMLDPNSKQDIWERLHFLTRDMSGVGPLDGLEKGGIIYAVVGTLIQIGIALLITIPLGLTTAIFLGEVGGRFARFVRTIVEAMTALPSVVAGLFIYAAYITVFTHEDSGFAASLAITVLMLPIMIRSSDVVLRLVPGNLREAGLALGAGQWATVWHVVLPTVRSGLITAIILATAHGIGETAPVLLTSGVTTFTNFDPFHNPMTSLPLAALEFAESPQPIVKQRGFATAVVLLVLVLILFAVARAIGGSQPGMSSATATRRLVGRSRAIRDRVQGAAAGRAPHDAAPSPEPEPAAPEEETR